MIDHFRRDRRGAKDGIAVCIGWHAIQINPARLEAFCIGRIGEHVGCQLVTRGEIVTQVPVAEGGCETLRRQYGALCHDQRIDAGKGNALADSVGDDRNIRAVLAIVVQPDTRLDRQPVGQMPAKLAEQCCADIVEPDVVGCGQAVQYRGISAERIGWSDQPLTRRGALRLCTLRANFLIIAESTKHEIEIVQLPAVT